MSSDDPGVGPPSPEDTQDLSALRPATPGALRRRGPSPVFLVVLLSVGAILGASAGVVFSRWWAGRYASAAPPASSAQPLPPQSAFVPPPTALPELLFSTANVRPTITPDVLEAGAKEIHCFFVLPGEDPSRELSVWWLSAVGEPVRAEATVAKESGPDLRGHIVLQPPAGKPAFGDGLYEIALRVNGEQVADGSFAVLKGAAKLLQRPPGLERYRPEIRNLRVASVQPHAASAKPCVLPGNTARVMATFDFGHALSGTAFTVRWLYDDGLIAQATTEVVIKADQGKAQVWFGRKPPAPLPVGKYGVAIFMGGGTAPLAQEPFWIGRRPTPAELGQVR